MLKTETIPQTLQNDAESAAHIPWYLWCAALAVTSAMIGGRWDVSWHESIGRDTFWTPAHMAIYLCGVLAGVVCGYLILSTTFREINENCGQLCPRDGFHRAAGSISRGLGRHSDADFCAVR